MTVPSNDRPPFPAYSGDEPYVFVCYAHSDRAVVYAELVRLRDSGVNIWYDEGIAPGSEWTEELANAIHDCTQFLYFVSPESVATRNCRDEVQFALKHHRKIVAVHVVPTDLPRGLELAIGATQAILKYQLSQLDYERKLLASLHPKASISTVSRKTHRVAVATPNSLTRARYRLALIAAALVVLLGGAAVYWAMPPPTPHVTAYTPLTKSVAPNSPWYQPLVTDGLRIYFNAGSEPVLSELSVAGGEPISVAVPSGVPSFVRGVSRDRSELVLTERNGGPFWLWSPAGGAPRRFLTLEGHDLSWSADGTRLVTINGLDISVANVDASEMRKVYTAPEPCCPIWARLSPDGTRVRFSAGTTRNEIWEVAADGTNPHFLFPDHPELADTCCGSWTPDGRHYVFEAIKDGQQRLWVLDEGRGPFAGRGEPHLLTPGPMYFIRASVSPDGKRLFAMGGSLRGELMRYDATSGHWVPHIDVRSVTWLAYSRDGKRAAYATYPEGDLWVSDADGSNAIQVTAAPMQARQPEWAPNGSSVAFVAGVPGASSKIYRAVASQGWAPQVVMAEDRSERWPSWSSDSNSLAFLTDAGIRIYDVNAKRDVSVPGGEKMGCPKWSPDGRYLAALASEPKRIMLFEIATQRWMEFAGTPGAVALAWAPNAQWIDYLTDANDVYRVRVEDRHLERVVSLKDEKWAVGVGGVGGPWVGHDADGSILYLREQSVRYIYSLDWDA